MKVDILDAHDRLLNFKQQSDYIGQGCQDCINNRPVQFTMPFYIFAHTRTIEVDERISIYNDDLMHSMVDKTHVRKYRTVEEVPSSRLIWTPRLSKPTPQSNSMLFKAYPPSDNVKIIWMLPARELWGQFTKGNMTQNQIVVESIDKFLNHFEALGAPEEDDMPDNYVNEIYADIAKTYAPATPTKKFEMI